MFALYCRNLRGKYLLDVRKGLSSYKNPDKPLYERLCFTLVKKQAKNKSESWSCEEKLMKDKQGKFIKSHN